MISTKIYSSGISMLLMNVISIIVLCCTSGCDFIQERNSGMPYKDIHTLTAKMLYERGDYFYKKATTTHFWQGASETDMDELEQARIYYSKALAKGYRPKTGYDHLLECYAEVGDDNRQEAGFTSLITAYPDSAKYWNSRAMNRRRQKNYYGALEDLNQILKLKSSYELMADAYYQRGAVKYMLYPKDTADAEADRLTALKLVKMHGTLEPYYDYCIVGQLDSKPYDKDDPDSDDTFKEQEAENTANFKAHPDSMLYLYLRALNRQHLRNYKGALTDLNRLLKSADNVKNIENTDYKNIEEACQIDLETAYYMRGAVKYRLNRKDTSAAEADRLIAIKLHRKKAMLIPYKAYCSNWNNDSY